MGRAGDRLREIAGRLDELGEDLKGKAQEAIERTIDRLTGLVDKAEAGEEVTDEEAAPEEEAAPDEGAPQVDNSLPEGEGPPEATQLPS